MVDFVKISSNFKKDKVIVYPQFKVIRSNDLLIKGRAFYAIWDEERGIWCRDELDAVRLIDKELYDYARTIPPDMEVKVLDLATYSTGMWKSFKEYLTKLSDSPWCLDEKITFSNDEVTREDHVSKKTNYAIESGPCPAWMELMSTLYDPEELQKIEWAIGSIITGESQKIQKFYVFFGAAGTGKSTVLNIIGKLFGPYTVTFDAKSLGKESNAFATEVFKNNPLVAIQHDGDLSTIQDNTKFNSIVSHEPIVINEKYKSTYSMPIRAALFIGTNQPVKITDSKSGLIRRLIDISPSGNLIPINRYETLVSRVNFELGAIAARCRDIFLELGPNFYDGYRPFDMMYKTDVFYNFMDDCYMTFKEQGHTTLKQAWTIYKNYCQEANVQYMLPMYRFREELKDYFAEYSDITRFEGKQYRSFYNGFLTSKFRIMTDEEPENSEPIDTLVIDQTDSFFNKECSGYFAQLANENGTPQKKWEEVTTKLSDIDVTKLHYVLLPDTHIVIDFDLKNENGEKDRELNLAEASKWPPTYAEWSKSGAGIHLHYYYDGDAARLSRVYDTGIEIKVFTGNASLRRKFTQCNNLPIAHISSGLPLKEGKTVVDTNVVLSEKKIREMIERNLRKEIHNATKPSIDFIYTILSEQYERGAHYDVSDMIPRIMAFAAKSTNHSTYCLKMVNRMKFKSDEPSDPVESPKDDPIVFFDVEVFPNLLLINWKYQGEGHNVVRMINPSPLEVAQLMEKKLVGFNNLRYDNHILYARMLGWNNKQIYDLSQKIINKGRDAFFMEAYNVSYTDIYDFASAPNKKSLKKWEIELGLHHQELGLPWDQPVPEEDWVKVAEYCDNDVISTEAVFNHLQADWKTRQILSVLSGLPVNATTNQHSTAFIFGKERHPGLIYTDLSTGQQYLPGEKGPYDPK